MRAVFPIRNPPVQLLLPRLFDATSLLPFRGQLIRPPACPPAPQLVEFFLTHLFFVFVLILFI